MSPDLYWVAVALTTLVATSRLIRLWTYDDFPPVRWANSHFMEFAEKRAPKWAELGFCPWCCGFWIALVVIGLGWACGVYETVPETDWSFKTWWIAAGALTASYLGAMLMARDGDSTRDEPDNETV